MVFPLEIEKINFAARAITMAVGLVYEVLPFKKCLFDRKTHENLSIIVVAGTVICLILNMNQTVTKIYSCNKIQ